MRQIHKLPLWLVVSSAGLACAQAQKPAVAEPAGSRFIFRMQQTTLEKQECAIVREDGRFHVEQETANRLDVAEGNLDDGELNALKAVLNNKDLAALTQQKILAPLIVSQHDTFQFSIFRSVFTQNVVFLDRESRRPFDEYVGPMLHWMDILQRHGQTKLDEYSGRNNCMPPREIHFSKRGARTSNGEPPPGVSESTHHASASSLPSPPPALFLVRWQLSHILFHSVEETCIVVYPSGQFRTEKSSHSPRENLKVRALESSFSENELHELKAILDAPRLKDSTHQNFAKSMSVHEGEFSALDVPRDGRIQQLRFASYFGFDSKFGAGTDPEERIVRPLQKWLNRHADAKKMQAIPEASVTYCAALPNTARQ